MKKIILTVAAVFAFGFANAQDKEKKGGFGFSEGDFYLGGMINFSSDKDELGSASTTTSALEFSPEAGYFVTDKLAITAGLSIGNSKVDNGTNEVKNNTFGANVGIRYYFLDMGERFKTYASAGLGFGSDDNGGNGAEKTNTFGLGAGLGINYFVTENLAIDFGLSNVLSFNSEKTGDAKSTSINGTINEFDNFFNTATFGLIYKF
jgi:outer membrane protein